MNVLPLMQKKKIKKPDNIDLIGTNIKEILSEIFIRAKPETLEKYKEGKISYNERINEPTYGNIKFEF